MRIKGVGEEWSDLLEAAGVDTVKELKHRKAANLHAKLVGEALHEFTVCASCGSIARSFPHLQAEIASTAHGSQPGAVKRIPALKQVRITSCLASTGLAT